MEFMKASSSSCGSKSGIKLSKSCDGPDPGLENDSDGGGGGGRDSGGDGFLGGALNWLLEVVTEPEPKSIKLPGFTDG